jgi:uncharacterized integral membrane protein
VSDDDLDLDLDLDSPPDPPKKRGLFGRAKAPDKPAEGEAGEGAAEARKPEVVPAHKPSVFERIAAPVSEGAAKASPTGWSLKTFVMGFIGLVILVLIAENWPAMRLNFVGLHVDVPKSVVLLVTFGLGFGVSWLMFRRRGEPGQPKI